jgi:hypothetical protein
MLVAAAAVPLINYFVPTTELANQIADALGDVLALPAPAPTNNPDAGAAMPDPAGSAPGQRDQRRRAHPPSARLRRRRKAS